MPRIFLLSPARCDGQRAQMLFSKRARFDLAMRLQAGKSAPLGEMFTFMSGLYFRGKIAYARAFAPDGALIITTNRGLVPTELPMTLADLRALGADAIDAANERFAAPLRRDAAALAAVDAEVVLLGSVASGKYVDHLVPILGERLLFPADFVGRGDMSRGGLMLRAAASGEELPYISVAGAVCRGKRPPKLVRLPKTTTAGTAEPPPAPKSRAKNLFLFSPKRPR